jgi:hypothetical protein
MKLFDFAAIGLNVGLALNMTIAFFLAYFNGGEVLITINRFGEQRVEAILFPVIILMGVITLIRRTRGSEHD